MPRFEPRQVLPADDLNVMAAQIERNGELFVGRAAPTGGTPPSNARMKMQAFSLVASSNDGGYIDFLWPDGPFDQVAFAFVEMYGLNHASRRLLVNYVDNNGASLRLVNSSGSEQTNQSNVQVQVLGIGWMLD
jgi:hypothetical protein